MKRDRGSNARKIRHSPTARYVPETKSKNKNSPIPDEPTED